MDKIADYLLLRSSYMQELGLFHGKNGRGGRIVSVC